MTTDAQIIAEYEAIEDRARKAPRMPDAWRIVETVAEKLGVEPDKVRDVIRAHITSTGAG